MATEKQAEYANSVELDTHQNTYWTAAQLNVAGIPSDQDKEKTINLTATPNPQASLSPENCSSSSAGSSPAPVNPSSAPVNLSSTSANPSVAFGNNTVDQWYNVEVDEENESSLSQQVQQPETIQTMEIFLSVQQACSWISPSHQTLQSHQ
ncbi:hypothetical protein K435DRAFT_853452 [Dendrothele bispora CBS 962.96]|uniref:Uncharacterized protein n=1 Tax=Dendrothele bispora (strain CBS 962.96) TaxID=1314807 RepID=A0A4S8MHW3_DENBC|nr:hypothetical protein K435DRAFT_853452 [Dendrothele bispora CBS 962.96]